jgi:hypothetical protein
VNSPISGRSRDVNSSSHSVTARQTVHHNVNRGSQNGLWLLENRPKEGPKKSHDASICFKDIGINYNQSSRWQKLASVLIGKKYNQRKKLHGGDRKSSRHFDGLKESTDESANRLFIPCLLFDGPCMNAG